MSLATQAGLDTERNILGLARRGVNVVDDRD
jgi:hypothetical protein